MYIYRVTIVIYIYICICIQLFLCFFSATPWSILEKLFIGHSVTFCRNPFWLEYYSDLFESLFQFLQSPNSLGSIWRSWASTGRWSASCVHVLSYEGFVWDRHAWSWGASGCFASVNSPKSGFVMGRRFGDANVSMLERVRFLRT